MFTDTEIKRLLAQMDLEGKIVLTESGGRQNMIFSRQKGAAGYIHMWSRDVKYIHEGIVWPD